MDYNTEEYEMIFALDKINGIMKKGRLNWCVVMVEVYICV
jgi:hypothetical protein